MEVFVNGELRQVPEETTIADLLRQLKLDQHHVAVELNREVAPRTRHAEQRLAAGDRLEIVTFVGGGQV